jgi:hypothetical protein
MAGKYEIAFTVEKDGEKVEKVVNYEVKQPKGVASITGVKRRGGSRTARAALCACSENQQACLTLPIKKSGSALALPLSI